MDPNGVVHCVSNTFFDRFSRMLLRDGFLKVILPLVILIFGFFLVQRYTKNNKKFMILYSVVGILVYALILWIFSAGYYYE